VRLRWLTESDAWMIAGMAIPGAEPVEGGVKIVFDVPEELAVEIAAQLGDAGFDVRRYYRSADEAGRPGGAATGFVRLGAERPMRAFTDSEQAGIVAAFEAAQVTRRIRCTIVGVDTWQAGGGSGRPGVREPRRPRPRADAPGAVVELPT
jgi:hypothetical protein